MPFIARGVRAEGVGDGITGLDATALGVSFVELADPYQSVTRSLKFVLLFLGLLFLSYFVFEVTTGKRVHPAQYILVGIAQIIFYLLLLSLAERIGFDFGFLIARRCHRDSALHQCRMDLRKPRCRLFALLSSSRCCTHSSTCCCGSKTTRCSSVPLRASSPLPAAMYFTRSIDWYGSLPDTATPNQ